MACFKLKHFRHQIFGRGPCRKSPTFSARARAENLLPEISNRKCALSGSARNRKILKTEKGQKKVWKSGSSRNGLIVHLFFIYFFSVSFMLSYELCTTTTVDVPLIFSCPADHVLLEDWQPRILLSRVDVRSVKVKNALHTHTHPLGGSMRVA